MTTVLSQTGPRPTSAKDRPGYAPSVPAMLLSLFLALPSLLEPSPPTNIRDCLPILYGDPSRWAVSGRLCGRPGWPRRSDHALCFERRHLLLAVAQLSQHFISMLTEKGGM